MKTIFFTSAGDYYDHLKKSMHPDLNAINSAIVFPVYEKPLDMTSREDAIKELDRMGALGFIAAAN